MVYCTKCGTKNVESAQYCTQCGAPLGVSGEKRIEERAKEWGEEFGRRAEEWGEQFERRADEECTGFASGGIVVGLIVGAIIILVGLSFFLQVTGVITQGWDVLWPFIVIIFGVMIVIGALVSFTRRS